MAKKVNHYAIFFDWLFDYNLDSEIPYEVIENKNQFSIHFMINMLMKYKRICLFANKYLNNYNFISLRFEDMIKALKYVVYKFNLSKNDIFYSKFKYNDVNKEVLSIQKRYPYIKISEIKMFLDEYKKIHMEQSDNKVKKLSKSKSKIKHKVTLKDLNNLFDNKESCGQCPLINEPLILFDTNRKANCYNVDVLFISNKPNKPDIKNRKPYTDKMYKIFKQYINNKLVKNKLSYFYSYLIPCVTNNMDNVQFCLNRIKRLVDLVQPKNIVLMGDDVINSLNVSYDKTNISNIDCKILGRKVYCISHPYVLSEGNHIEKYNLLFDQICGG